jgi:RluA family pseudouridine synthase
MWDIPVVYEDEDLLAVNKPAGLPTQAGQDPRRANLYALLQESRKEKLFLHHRLDKDTSGVLLLGRHPRANKGLTDLFREHRLTKIYWALAKKPANEDVDAFTVKDHLAPVRGSNKQLMRMVRVKSGGRFAETHFRRLNSLARADLWEARPLTGRTHQIRVHLAGTGRPIWGDFLYGGKSSEVPRLLLHARSLELAHPVTGKPLKIEAPLPADFSSILKNWGSRLS